MGGLLMINITNYAQKLAFLVLNEERKRIFSVKRR